jgi:hypothetical protein
MPKEAVYSRDHGRVSSTGVLSGGKKLLTPDIGGKGAWMHMPYAGELLV